MRFLLLIPLLLGLAACEPAQRTTAATAPPLDTQILDREITRIAARSPPGTFDMGVLSIDGGESWAFNGDHAFPMQSVFKAPLGAAVLAEVDAGRLSLDEVLVIEEKDLSPPYSPVADAWPARRAYAVRELLTLAVGGSDNTAADVLMRRIGGPGGVQAWLTEKEIVELRIDRFERELQPDVSGLASFRPAWKGEAAFVQAIETLPPAHRRAALEAYLEDPRDTATVPGALAFLRRLAVGELLSPASTKLLLQIMTDTRTGQARLKAGLPAGARLAHKTGTGRTVLGVNPATNDIGIVTLEDGRRYAVAVFVAGSPAPEPERDAMIADAARAVIAAAG